PVGFKKLGIARVLLFQIVDCPSEDDTFYEVVDRKVGGIEVLAMRVDQSCRVWRCGARRLWQRHADAQPFTRDCYEAACEKVATPHDIFPPRVCAQCRL